MNPTVTQTAPIPNTSVSLVPGGSNVTTNGQTTFVPKASNNSAITSDALQPQTPITVTQPNQSTAAPALNGLISSGVDSYNQNLINQQNAAATATNTSLANYAQAQAAQKGITTLQGQAEQAAGIDPAQSALTDINNQIFAERNSLNHQLASLDQNALGGTQSQINAQKQNAQTQSLSKQADMAIIQYAAQNKFDNVKAIADRQAAMQFEQQQNNLTALQTTYNNNKDLFTAAEQRAFTSAQATRQVQLDQQKADYTNTQTQKISLLQQAQVNGAPISVLSAIQGAQSAQDAINAAGQYGVDKQSLALKQAQIGQANAGAASSYANAALSRAELGMYNNGGASGSSNLPVGSTGSAGIDATTPGYTTKIVAGGLTQSAIDQQAMSYLLKGTKPPTGSSRNIVGQQQGIAITNRMGEIDPGGNIQGNKVQLAALSSSLKTQTNYLNTQQRALDTANAGFQQILTTFKSAGVDPTQFPTINAAISAVQGQIAPADIKALKSALAEVGSQYGVVFSKGGQPTESTRATGASITGGDLSLADMQKTLTTMQQLGETDVKTTQGQVDKIQGQINGILNPGGTSGADTSIGGGSTQPVPQAQIPDGYYQASDGLFYKKQ